MRDIEAAYRDAMKQEHASLLRAGRQEEADHVAEQFKAQYGTDIDGKTLRAKPQKDEQAAPERADVPQAPENTAEPKPVRRPGRRPAAAGE